MSWTGNEFDRLYKEIYELKVENKKLTEFLNSLIERHQHGTEADVLPSHIHQEIQQALKQVSKESTPHDPHRN